MKEKEEKEKSSDISKLCCIDTGLTSGIFGYRKSPIMFEEVKRGSLFEVWSIFVRL